MEFWANYGLFFIKLLTLVLGILLVMGGIIAMVRKGKDLPKNKLEIKHLNKKYAEYSEMLNESTLTKAQLKKVTKEQKLAKKKADNEKNSVKKRIFVLNFIGDMRASAVNSLREEITAVLGVATPQDEVVISLESPGGVVSNYGLAASQLSRLKENKIPLTVIVDKVAASGGYMMAVVADKIYAAPFAIIGSIGVVAQIPNFHRLLNKNNIDFELLTAGEYKRTLTLFGENTEKGREKLQEEIEEIHQYFKSFIGKNRPQLDLAQVATGEHWMGYHALDLKLVDGLTTTDDYLLTASKNAELYQVSYSIKKSLQEKLFSSASKMKEEALTLFNKNHSATPVEYL